jgi:hypothetical protein
MFNQTSVTDVSHGRSLLQRLHDGVEVVGGTATRGQARRRTKLWSTWQCSNRYFSGILDPLLGNDLRGL